MAKSRIAEKSQTGSLQSTPAGDQAAGTPGSRDHLKGEWIQGLELGLDRRRGRVPGGAPAGKGPPLGSGDLLGVWGLFSPRREERESGGPGFGPLAQHKAGHLVGER